MKQLPSRIFTLCLLLLLTGITSFADTPAGVSNGSKHPTVALVLAGGSAYGLAHVGVIKVLEEMGIPVDIVVGASMGSIVGGLYAIGYDAAGLEKIANETDWTDMFMEEAATGNESFTESADRARYAAAVSFDRQGFSLNGGLIVGRKILRFMDSLTLSVPTPADFDKLPKRYRSVATDVATGKQVVLADGSIADAMRASMSIPGVFTPYCLKGQYLVDGGLVDNLPIDLARRMGANIVIAVDLVDGTPYDPDKDNRTPMAALSRSFNIVIRATEDSQLPHADLVIPVDIRGFLITDFPKSKELIARGEATARSHGDALEKIKLKALGANPEGTAEAAPTKTSGPDPLVTGVLPPIASITVTGAAEKNKAAVAALFAPLIGTNPGADELRPLFRMLDRTGLYDQVRVSRDAKAPGAPLNIILTAKRQRKNEIRLNFVYETTFAGAITGNLNLVPALVYRGLTTKDSRLLVDAELIDAPSLNVRFVQPLGQVFSINPYYAYRREFTTRLTSTAAGYQYQTISQTAGADLALEPAPGLRIEAGWCYDWIDTAQIPEIPDTGKVSTASLLRARLGILKLDSTILPTAGLASSTVFVASLPELGSERRFRTLETDGRLYIPVTESVSTGLLWIAGTDFSEGLTDDTIAPSFYKPDLANRRMFPGPLRIDEQIGSHVAGLGLELKYDLNRGGKGIKIPVFVLVNAAAGAIIQNPRNTDWQTDVFHWNATAGLGIRLTNAFGVVVRGGIQRSVDSTLTPFIALDLGAIGY